MCERVSMEDRKLSALACDRLPVREDAIEPARHVVVV